MRRSGKPGRSRRQGLLGRGFDGGGGGRGPRPRRRSRSPHRLSHSAGRSIPASRPWVRPGLAPRYLFRRAPRQMWLIAPGQRRRPWYLARGCLVHAPKPDPGGSAPNPSGEGVSGPGQEACTPGPRPGRRRLGEWTLGPSRVERK